MSGLLVFVFMVVLVFVLLFQLVCEVIEKVVKGEDTETHNASGGKYRLRVSGRNRSF